MNAYNKGSQFEELVYQILKKELDEGNLPIQASYSQIFRKKGYFSKDRNKDIITDISIEVTMPGASNWSILLVIECKNYGHKVPVDDLEEFYAKVTQIAGLNVKAIFVTRNSLQESALNFAKSKGIAVARIVPIDVTNFKLNFDHHYITFKKSDYDAFLQEEYEGITRFFALKDGEIHKNWSNLLVSFFNDLT